jgi:hypothetical protein
MGLGRMNPGSCGCPRLYGPWYLYGCDYRTMPKLRKLLSQLVIDLGEIDMQPVDHPEEHEGEEWADWGQYYWGTTTVEIDHDETVNGYLIKAAEEIECTVRIFDVSITLAAATFEERPCHYNYWLTVQGKYEISGVNPAELGGTLPDPVVSWGEDLTEAKPWDSDFLIERVCARDHGLSQPDLSVFYFLGPVVEVTDSNSLTWQVARDRDGNSNNTHTIEILSGELQLRPYFAPCPSSCPPATDYEALEAELGFAEGAAITLERGDPAELTIESDNVRLDPGLFIVSGVPSGMTLDSDTWIISGIPDSLGVFTVRLRGVVDSGDNEGCAIRGQIVVTVVVDVPCPDSDDYEALGAEIAAGDANVEIGDELIAVTLTNVDPESITVESEADLFWSSEDSWIVWQGLDPPGTYPTTLRGTVDSGEHAGCEIEYSFDVIVS